MHSECIGACIGRVLSECIGTRIGRVLSECVGACVGKVQSKLAEILHAFLPAF